MRQFMKIINENLEVDRHWIVNKMVTDVTNGSHWDSFAMRRDDNGKLQHWEMGDDSQYDMAREWAAELRLDHMEDHEIIDTHAFQERIRAWANARFDQVVDKISHLTQGDTIPAHRFMRVTEQWVNDIRAKGSAKLGIYWTFDLENAQELDSIWGHEQPGEEILIHAHIPVSGVDWHYTILANMDWLQGDRENEVRVKQDAPLKVDFMQTVEDGTRLDVTGVKFTA